MEEKETITLDFAKCLSLREVFDEMARQMEWRSDYPYDIYSLWDILWDLPHKGNDFIIIRPAEYANPKFTEQVNKVCRVFERAQEHERLTCRIEYTEGKND